MHGFEIGIGAQEWKTCQASTSGDADHVHSLLFYLLLLRTFSPREQDCTTRGEGKDQLLPFKNLHPCRFRSCLEGRRSDVGIFLQPASRGVSGDIHDGWAS